MTEWLAATGKADTVRAATAAEVTETRDDAAVLAMQAGWVAILILAAYPGQLAGLVGAWLADAEMSHGLLVPVVFGYLLWQRRHALAAENRVSSPAGLLLVLGGIVLFFASLPGNWTFLLRCSILIIFAGSLLYLCGSRWMKHMLLPLAVLLFMIPQPTFLYEAATFRLQLLASSIAERALEVLGYSVLREGNILELPGVRLSVVEACSGMRSIFSLAFFSVAFTKLAGERWWVCLLILPLTIPIAVLLNAARIVSTGMVSAVDAPLAAGRWHSAAGWVSSLSGMAAVVVLAQAVSWARRRGNAG